VSSDRLQHAWKRACFGTEAAFEPDLRAFLAASGVAKEDIEAMLAAPRRLGLYRKLVRHNIVGVIEAMLPRTRERMDRVVPGSFVQSIDAFLEHDGPRTAHLRDVPSEFLAFAVPRWKKDDRLPRWLADYAELELVDFVIGVAPRPAPAPPLADVSADLPLVFGDPRRLVRLAWSVHEEKIEERAVTILVYRDAEHRTRFLELTHLAGLILERLFAGDALGPAMISSCHTMGCALDDAVLAGAAHLLADLGERGVLLGASEAEVRAARRNFRLGAEVRSGLAAAVALSETFESLSAPVPIPLSETWIALATLNSADTVERMRGAILPHLSHRDDRDALELAPRLSYVPFWRVKLAVAGNHLHTPPNVISIANIDFPLPPPCFVPRAGIMMISARSVVPYTPRLPAFLGGGPDALEVQRSELLPMTHERAFELASREDIVAADVDRAEGEGRAVAMLTSMLGVRAAPRVEAITFVLYPLWYSRFGAEDCFVLVSGRDVSERVKRFFNA
jgi:hypothetical protein